MEKGKVSVIIPAYNVVGYIFKCVESVLKQTYQNFEIIIINDGSTDNTFECMEVFRGMDKRIKIFDSENMGQGHQRNTAVNYATGEFILFLDSDDYIEPYTLELAVKRIVEDKSDLVYFDWKYYVEKTGRFNYKNKEMFFGRKTLEGEDCVLLLSISPYFSVNRLYSRDFIVKNNIKYGEGYIYEDNPFIVATAFYAKKISIIHSPLYVVRVSNNSTTKRNTGTDQHYLGFLESVRKCTEILQQNPNEQHYYYYKYALTRYFLYIRTRVPKEFKEEFTKHFLDILSVTDIKVLKKNDKIMKLLLAHDVFKKKKYNYMLMAEYYFRKIKPKKKKLIKKIKAKKAKIKVFFRNLKRKLKGEVTPPAQSQAYKKYLKQKLMKNTILFLGFDYKYTGNSRYLFEMMIKNNEASETERTIYFATNDTAVDEKYRLKPNSDRFFKVLATANVLIFESWTIPTHRKRLNAVWIQLWHGTPLKKMLFDSEEAEIITKRDNHKINKYIEIQKWDYMITDNENINRYFETSFMTERNRFIPCGYPRVKYLKDNINNNELKDSIKERYQIDKNKKAVVYLPTWRDYNYGKTEDIDTDYLLDTELLQSKLGDGYQIIDKNHFYLNNSSDESQNMETQELLLIADYLITDYSSVMFDAFAIDVPVVLYSNDFERYQQSRGVYPEIWSELEGYVCTDVNSLCNMITNYKFDEQYQYIKDKYCFKDNVKKLLKKIDNALDSGDAKKRVMFLYNSDEITLDDLTVLREAFELGHKLLVLIDNGKSEEELYTYKLAIKALKYVNATFIKKDKSIEEVMEEKCIDTLALKDTPENRSKYENLYDEYETVFIKPNRCSFNLKLEVIIDEKNPYIRHI